MNQYYLVFFLFGLILFGAIVLLSYAQKKGWFAIFKPRPRTLTATEEPLLNPERKPKPQLDSTLADDQTPHLAQNRGDTPSVSHALTKVSSAAEKVKAKLGRSRVQSARTEPQTSVPEAGSKQASEEQSAGHDVSRHLSQAVAGSSAQPSPGDSTSAESDIPTQGGHSAAGTNNPQFDQASSNLITELVAKVKNPAPIEQQDLLVLFRNHDFKFHRKVNIYGLNELTDLWRDVEFELPSARFLELGISVQLADREGCMSQKELHDFQQMVLAFSNTYDAPFEFSMDLDDAYSQANLLDQIGRRYDSMAVLNVVPKSRSGFRVADIESCARDLMMSTDKNGIFMKTQGQKNKLSVLYRLACTDGDGQFGIASGSAARVHDLVVYMYVPAVQDPEKVFQEMVKDANDLATWLEGKVVDRHGRVMSQRSYSVLMQQVSDIAFSMQQDGLSPGDAVAKKLF